ncbi:MAG: hypothetical protein Q8O65_01250 [Nitrosopumilaceae archaeon]|nr:hypothetical protein [Nitrosopumilaceae archaeon]
MTVNAILVGQLAVQAARKIMMTFVVTAILRKKSQKYAQIKFRYLIKLAKPKL